MASYKPIPSLSDAQVSRFWSTVDKGPWPSGCWLWSGVMTERSYGHFFIANGWFRAHRVAWTLARGPIPGGRSLDHLCRNHSCVNPDHLEVVTHEVNVLRGESPTAKNATKTHCAHGHAFTPENTKFNRVKHRICIACRKIILERRMLDRRVQTTSAARAD